MSNETRLTFPAVPGAPDIRPVKASVARFASVAWTPLELIVTHSAGSADAARSADAAAAAFDALAREVLSISAALNAIEPGAVSDIPRSYRIRSRDRRHWDRQLATMEQLAELGLRLAKLSAALGDLPIGMDPRGDRLLGELVEASALEDRVAGLEARFEVLEALYEGAVDRINDFQGWRHGHILEIVIILLLLAEVALLIVKAGH